MEKEAAIVDLAAQGWALVGALVAPQLLFSLSLTLLDRLAFTVRGMQGTVSHLCRKVQGA